MERDQLAEIFFGRRADPAPWATDCPVRFDAWWAFAEPSPEGPQHLVDLILAIRFTGTQVTVPMLTEPTSTQREAFSPPRHRDPFTLT